MWTRSLPGLRVVTCEMRVMCYTPLSMHTLLMFHVKGVKQCFNIHLDCPFPSSLHFEGRGKNHSGVKDVSL